MSILIPFLIGSIFYALKSKFHFKYLQQTDRAYSSYKNYNAFQANGPMWMNGNIIDTLTFILPFLIQEQKNGVSDEALKTWKRAYVYGIVATIFLVITLGLFFVKPFRDFYFELLGF